MHKPQTNQLHGGRVGGMRRVIREFNRPINMLEIGTWCAEGSTQIWLQELQPGSSITLLDSWTPFLENDYTDNHFDYKAMDDRMHEAFEMTFQRVIEAEKQNDKNIKITMIRGNSGTYLSNFASNNFDFVYIDGSHYYEATNLDIQHAKRIVKQNSGVIGGDDLEYGCGEPYLSESKDFPNKDFIPLSTNPGIKFHPGVVLAVNEQFGENINNHDGFWWVYSNEGKFSKER